MKTIEDLAEYLTRNIKLVRELRLSYRDAKGDLYVLTTSIEKVYVDDSFKDDISVFAKALEASPISNPDNT